MELKHIIISFLFVNSALSFAQQDGEGVNDFYAGEVSKMISIPNSPEAQAFTKYGDVQVNMFSGTPQINVPLHSIQGRELSIPLSLTYDASGVKVEQKATWVGLSWNLNVGGRISRIVNGLPDDYFQRGETDLGYAYKTMFNDFPTNGNESVAEKTQRYLDDYVSTMNPQFSSKPEAEEYYSFLLSINKNQVDTQPDYFSLNVMGLNETIVFERVGNENIPRVMNNPRIKVEPMFEDYFVQGISVPYLSKWKVTGEDGTQYFFDIMEETLRVNLGDLEVPLGDIGLTAYGSSWVLTKIISKNQKDIYTFGYTGRFFETQPILPSSAASATLNIPINTTNWTPPLQESHLSIGSLTSSIRNQYLRTIRRNGILMAQFNLDARYDVPNDIQNTRLESIDLYDSSGGDLKSIDFNNDDYFNLDNATASNLAASGKSYSDVRLKLNGINIKGKDQATYQSYYFNYIQPDALPVRSSMAQDYLGYFNGVENTTMYPSYPLGNRTIRGANREPNCQFSMIGLLNQITYPTGGRTVYTYESHDEFRSMTDSGSSVLHSFNVSGSTNTDPDIFRDANGDQCLDISPLPKILIKAFRVPETKDYEIEYQAGNGRVVIVDPTLGPNSFRSYCDFEGDISQYRVWESGLSNNTLTLEAGGTYKIMLQSNFGTNDGYSDVFLNVKEDFSNTTRLNVPIGGHRIAKITDYSKGDDEALTKYYSYQKDGKSTASINYMPRALAQLPVVTDVDGPQSANYERLIRYASAPASTAPYVVYTSVNEHRMDNSGATLGKTTYDFFNGNQGATPNITPPFENYFVASLKSGTVEQKTVYDNQGEMVARDSTAYFETWPRPFRVKGMVVLTKEEYLDDIIILEERTPTSGPVYLTPVFYPAWGGCSGGGAASSVLGVNCPLPSYYNNLNKINSEYAPLGARPTNAAAIYGGVSMTKTETYFKDENETSVSVVTVEETEYDVDPENDGLIYYLPKKKRTTDSKNDIYETEYTYPFEISGIAYDSLVTNNNVTEVVKTVTTKDPDNNSEIISLRENDYSIFQPGDESIVLPTLVKTQKGGDSQAGLDDRVNFDFYPNGNLKTSKRVDGPTTVYLWGYNHMYPVAKIENATYTQVQNALNTTGEFDAGPEGLTVQQETDLRNGLPNSMVTTYTYSPSVGVTSMTDSRGYKMTYEYDDFNRLKVIKDDAGKLVNDYEYSYKQAASND